MGQACTVERHGEEDELEVVSEPATPRPAPRAYVQARGALDLRDESAAAARAWEEENDSLFGESGVLPLPGESPTLRAKVEKQQCVEGVAKDEKEVTPKAEPEEVYNRCLRSDGSWSPCSVAERRADGSMLVILHVPGAVNLSKAIPARDIAKYLRWVPSADDKRSDTNASLPSQERKGSDVHIESIKVHDEPTVPQSDRGSKNGAVGKASDAPSSPQPLVNVEGEAAVPQRIRVHSRSSEAVPEATEEDAALVLSRLKISSSAPEPTSRADAAAADSPDGHPVAEASGKAAAEEKKEERRLCEVAQAERKQPEMESTARERCPEDAQPMRAEELQAVPTPQRVQSASLGEEASLSVGSRQGAELRASARRRPTKEADDVLSATAPARLLSAAIRAAAPPGAATDSRAEPASETQPAAKDVVVPPLDPTPKAAAAPATAPELVPCNEAAAAGFAPAAAVVTQPAMEEGRDILTQSLAKATAAQLLQNIYSLQARGDGEKERVVAGGEDVAAHREATSAAGNSKESGVTTSGATAPAEHLLLAGEGRW
eukprot:TRINITY_DN15553_c0_g1_i1.p1 TRINITY_DN15553_c0_g1~~TRINITY_DN15553_c0_g1_i1.p1  ORF type:complete len:547 (+),score=139.88 TRINITY_DN15553_c0_g1_i1:100-1740(+)